MITLTLPESEEYEYGYLPPKRNFIKGTMRLREDTMVVEVYDGKAWVPAIPVNSVPNVNEEGTE